MTWKHYRLVGAGGGVVLIIVLMIALLLNNGNDHAPATVPTLSLSVGYPGGEPVTANAQWTPIVQTFNDVEMVLVPAGCFRMGSEDGQDNQKPVHQQCFDTPFWLDRTEVTRAQYETCVAASACPVKEGNEASNEPNQPVNDVSWFKARDYCAWREPGLTRLPTEREWEYAARGPDNLVYPWGNDFIADHVVYYDNSGHVTQPVGSRPSGASWVGAMDMSGNVWEWVSSLYQAYPYSEEAEKINDNQRVLRGGAFFYTETYLRVADRNYYYPSFEDGYTGLRCARSY